MKTRNLFTFLKLALYDQHQKNHRYNNAVSFERTSANAITHLTLHHKIPAADVGFLSSNIGTLWKFLYKIFFHVF